MHFSKRFQRFTKVVDFSHIRYISELYEYEDLIVNGSRSGRKVSFIGCSLDKNDSSVFKEYIENAEKISIYCYGFSDYRKAIGNLIRIFGSECVGELLRNQTIQFFDIKNLSTDDMPVVINPSNYYKKEMTANLDKLNSL